mgnify:CR=1 FL=1
MYSWAVGASRIPARLSWKACVFGFAGVELLLEAQVDRAFEAHALFATLAVLVAALAAVAGFVLLA